MAAPFRFDWRNFRRSLLAVLTGNLIYYLLWRFLPSGAQHHFYQLDWGLAVDFCVCLICYGIVRKIV